MEEAQRLLTVSVWKLYRCRLRRGGLRLHRSLQLSLLVRAARHRYLSARAAAETLPVPALHGAEPGQLPREPSGDPRDARCPKEPTAERPERAEPSGTGQKWGSPREDCTGERPERAEPSGTGQTWGSPRDCTGERPERAEPSGTGQTWGSPRDCTGERPERAEPSGAPRGERERGPSGDSPTAEPDPANRHRDPPTAAPRAGQKRRSSDSAGPGRGPVPSKRARLEAEAPPLPPGPPGRCSGPPAAAFGFLVRAVGAC